MDSRATCEFEQISRKPDLRQLKGKKGNDHDDDDDDDDDDNHNNN